MNTPHRHAMTAFFTIIILFSVFPGEVFSRVHADVAMNTDGFITGTLYEADGITPISPALNPFVGAFDPFTFDFKDGASINGDGTYQITLPPGPVKVYALANNRTYELYNESINLSDGAILTVSSGQTISGIDFTLGPSGNISGRVTDQNGNPIPNMNVDAIGQFGNSQCTDANGQYTLTSIPLNTPIQVVVGGPNFCDNGPQVYIREYWEEKGSFDEADLIQVTTPGQTIPNINFTLEQSGFITGTVYGANGTTPLSDGFVFAIDPTTLAFLGGVNINSNGTYTLPVRPGDAKVSAVSDNRARELYNNVIFINDGTIVTVPSGGTISDIDFSLGLSGQVSGRVTDTLGNPIPNMRVDALDIYGTGTCTDANGEYTMTNLPIGVPLGMSAGGLNDNFFCDGGSQDYLREYWQERRLENNADLIQLTTPGQELTGIDFTLQQGGTLSGRITAAENGSPVANTDICAFPYDQENYSGDSPFICARTDLNGNYLINSLPVGSYRVWTFPTDRLRLYYNNATTFNTATPVTVGAGEAVTDINFSLPQAGIISGLITDENSNPIDGVNVWVQPTTDPGPNLYPECSNSFASPTGTYSVYVPAGTWYVFASEDGPCGPVEFATQVYPSPITINIGQTIPNIDFQRVNQAQIDVNNDGAITPSDVAFVLNRLDTSDATADLNGDGTVTEADALIVLFQLGQSVP